MYYDFVWYAGVSQGRRMARRPSAGSRAAAGQRTGPDRDYRRRACAVCPFGLLHLPARDLLITQISNDALPDKVMIDTVLGHMAANAVRNGF